jgi:hypothetical protein
MAKEIKNYLKSVKDITAPLNWKSSPDSPPTQLAYITQPEIDMLVKANIHGSMKGKPNKGPKGIISLDGGGVEYFKDDKPVSFGDQAGVTIDVSTQEGQDKRQEFRDKTGSDVVTDAEKEAREEQGKDPADTSAPSGGITTVSTKDDDEEEEEKQGAIEFFKTAFEKLKGKDLTKPITDQELALYRALVGNQQANMPDYSILEAFVKNLGAMGEQVNPLTRYLGLGGDGEEFFRDDDEGLNLAKLRELERVISGDEQIGPFYGELVDGGVSVNLPGSLTLEGRTKFIDDMLGSEFEERLKRQNPEIYYPDNYMPATSGGLADLGSQAAINTTGMDRESDEYKQAVKYNNMIFSARAELDRMGKDMFGNTQGGGQGGGGGIYTPPVTPPVNPTDPTDPNPTLPITTPQIPTSRFPDSVIRDYTQLGLPQIYGNQQIPNYGNFYQGQGGQPIGLQNYLDNLRKRFGIG